MPLCHEHVGSKMPAKSKSMSSPEQNYLSLFAMRYPVEQIIIGLRKVLITPKFSGTNGTWITK